MLAVRKNAARLPSFTEKFDRLIEPSRIVTDPSTLDELSWDALSEGRLHPHHHPDLRVPLCAVKPRSTDEVRRVVQFANSEKIPLLPFGGGSGLMGGAISVRPSICVDLRESNQILDVDSGSRSVRAQAGVVLEALDARLSAAGF